MDHALFAGDARVLLFSCTSLPVVHLIERMESQWGLPVITSNQACLWASLNRASLEAPKGYGRLFKS